MTNLSIIVAIAEDGAIGKDNNLLCYLPTDLKHFKQITMGHAIIMGRKTFESLPKGALPGRRNIVVSRNPNFKAEGATVCASIDEALLATEGESERFIIGGAQLYNSTIGIADKLYLTLIHSTFPNADTHLQSIDFNEWTEIEREEHEADERNSIPFAFLKLSRK